MGPKLRKLERGPMYFLAPGWPSHLPEHSEPQLLGSRASQGCRMSRSNQAFIPVGLARRVRKAERQMGGKRTRKLTSVVTKTLKKI